MDNETLNERLLGWMKTRGPDDWHRVVSTYNWDNGMRPLLWIARQPQLDRATAHTMFWLTSPEWFLLGKLYRDGGRDPWEAGERELCVTLFDRVRSGSIPEGAFSTDHRDFVTAERWESYALFKGADPAEFRLPDWMHHEIAGRVVDLSGMDEGYPTAFFEN
ncbi:DUF4274 domain-containing protein [Roseobacter sp. HKCCA0434]|uniref:DUF4274 domain-containing protein n=1 Tax=Roseobacter sp. HKCCA0434 TaxID=3079297 RepID=UPI002905A827|nr:DUF4274 domain-containing protein [Roseobacter sp. HKCCA0434]